MIHTLTLHPAVDRTVTLAAPLAPGATQRAAGSADTAGGKGVNVARALRAAGVPARALVAVDPGDPLAALLDAGGPAWAALPAGGPTRVNLALLDPGGTTTKIDAAGPRWPDHRPAAVLDALGAPGAGFGGDDGADWLVCSGSLPPGAPPSTYADLAVAAAARGLRVAVDTSGPALLASAACPAVRVLAPNEAELAQALAALGDATPAGARATDDAPAPAAAPGLAPGPAAAPAVPDVVAAARALLATAPPVVGPGAAAPGERLVLVTCGARGAALVSTDGHWWVDAPEVEVVGTVGAGDAALAGLVAALAAGADPPAALARAVAWGSAAVTVPPGAPLPAGGAPHHPPR